MNPHPERPLRVLHLTGPLNRGGVETWLVHLLRHADRRVLALDFVTTAARPAAYDDEVVSLGAKLLRCPHPERPLVFGPRFLRLLREHGPYDAVHSHIHHFGGFALLLARLARVPVRVATSHFDTAAEDARAAGPRRAYHAAARNAMRGGASRRLAVSGAAAAALYGPDWAARGARLARLGLDLRPFEAPVDAGAVRAELGLPPGEPVVGHVGRFDPQKNHAFLLEAFAAFLERFGPAQLLLVGDGPLRPEMEARARELGLVDRVRFLGSRPDVPRLLVGGMDVFVFPSLFEGLSLALVEAQLAGLPCLVSDGLTPGSRLPGAHVFTRRLQDGPATWAEGIAQTLAAGRTELADRSFDIARNAEELRELYAGRGT